MISRRRFLATTLAASGVVAGSAAGLHYGNDLFRRRGFGLSIAGSADEVVKRALAAGSDLDRNVDTVNFFQAWEWQQGFPYDFVAAAHKANALPQITWEPWDPRLDASQSRYRLDHLHHFDSYVDGFAAAAAATGRPVNIRFGHEMNNNWFPWSVLANDNSPDSYIKVFRRLHARFVDAGADKVTWTWSPNVIRPDEDPGLLRACYPGDDVVDVIGLDGYDQAKKLTPKQLFGRTLATVRDIAPEKPVWINETGVEPGPHKAQWLRDLFSYLETTDVERVLWFEINRGDRPDWRLRENAQTLAAARKALAHW